MTQIVDFACFCEVLSVELDLPLLVELSDFVDDEISLDSLLRFEILMIVEDWAGVMLPDALIAHLKTLDDFYDVYCTRVSQRGPDRVARDP